MPTNKITLITTSSKDYELIDSGLGEKLERFGHVVVSRPDPQALWKKALPASEWSKAGAKKTDTESGWAIDSFVPPTWPIEFAGKTFLIKPAAFKHVGLFPEQASQWVWISEAIKKRKSSASEPVTVLNLFGYTGGATLAAAAAGAQVTHVDASRPAVTWAKENAALSKLEDKPIRWIVDDALAFVRRELRRGNRYDAIIMDPPAFGRGPKGEVWKIEEALLGLLDDCAKLLSPQPLFFILNGYASGYSAIAYEQCLASVMKGKGGGGGTIEAGELAIQESSAGRLLPAGIFARWLHA